MFVNRRIFEVKTGRMDEFIALMRDAWERKPANLTRPVRIYRIVFGPWNLVAQEIECESLAEYERIEAEWIANIPPHFWERYNEVAEQGGGNELWSLIEF